MEKGGWELGVGGEAAAISVLLDMWNLRCLLGIRAEMLGRHLCVST